MQFLETFHQMRLQRRLVGCRFQRRLVDAVFRDFSSDAVFRDVLSMPSLATSRQMRF